MIGTISFIGLTDIVIFLCYKISVVQVALHENDGIAEVSMFKTKLKSC